MPGKLLFRRELSQCCMTSAKIIGHAGRGCYSCYLTSPYLCRLLTRNEKSNDFYIADDHQYETRVHDLQCTASYTTFYFSNASIAVEALALKQ